MKTIHKYSLKPSIVNTITMPKGAEILTVQVQRGGPQLWALVDPHAELEVKSISVWLTGDDIPNDVGEYVATFQLADGDYVLHVFQK